MAARISNTSSTANCGTALYPLQCPLASPFYDGREGVCYRSLIYIPVCSTFALDVVDDSAAYGEYTRHVHYTTTYADLDKICTQNSIQASIHVAGLALSCLTFCYMLILTPEHKRYTTIFRALLVGLLCSIMQQSVGTWLFTSSVRVAVYPVLTNDWASTELSISYRAALIIMHTTSVMALACVQVALYAQRRSLLTRLKLKYPSWVYNISMGGLVLLSIVAFLYQMAFQGYLLFWYGFPPRGVMFNRIPEMIWYQILQFGSIIAVCVSLGSWSLVITQNTLNIIWERRAALFSIDSSGIELNMSGARVVDTHLPGRNKRKSKISNIFEATLTMVGLVSCQSFVAPLLIIIFTFLYRDQYQFDSLLVAVLLALLPLSSIFSNVSGEKAKTVEAEVVQRRGYPIHQFHPLPGAEKREIEPHCSQLGQAAELSELD